MKRKRILSLAAVAAMMAACSSNDIPAPVVDKMADTPVMVNAAVADLATRAGTPLTEGSLGLFFTTSNLDGTTNERYTVSNKEVKYDNNAWTVQGTPLLWMNSTDDVTYYAYYPYVESVTGTEMTITAAADQTNGLATDFLCAASQTTTGEASGGSIDIAFKHQMAKLTIILRKGSAMEETVTYSGVTVGGFANEGAFDLAAGAWKTINTNKVTDINMKPKDATSYEALLIPQTADLSVSIAVGYDTYRYTQSGVTLEAGKAYTLHLLIGKDKVEVSSASTTEWSHVTNINMESD